MYHILGTKNTHVSCSLSANHKASSFGVVLSGYVQPAANVHQRELLFEIARILKPGGKVFLQEPVLLSGEHPELRNSSKLESMVKLAGFIKTSKVRI